MWVWMSSTNDSFLCAASTVHALSSVFRVYVGHWLVGVTLACYLVYHACRGLSSCTLHYPLLYLLHNVRTASRALGTLVLCYVCAVLLVECTDIYPVCLSNQLLASYKVHHTSALVASVAFARWPLL